jgi:hypothetical protein
MHPKGGKLGRNRLKIGRSAYGPAEPAADNRGKLSEYSLHRIDEELHEGWIDAWVADGLVDVEAYLGKHAAFDAFLDGRE